jgi:hypothetical protein
LRVRYQLSAIAPNRLRCCSAIKERTKNPHVIRKTSTTRLIQKQRRQITESAANHPSGTFPSINDSNQGRWGGNSRIATIR